MEVKIKKLLPEAVIPQYAHLTDAGLDLTAISKVEESNGIVTYGTGLAFEIPKGYVGLLFPRSSNSKKDLMLTNSVGILDSGYIGEVTLKFKKTIENGVTYDVGDRIGQLIILPYPKIELQEVEELSESDRGEGGFGSTGK